jgi:hypothetical protein
MQRKVNKALVLIFALPLYQSFVGAQEDIERDIPLDKIPSHIIEAVTRAKQGIHLKSAEEVYRETLIIYEIEGIYNGKNVEIMISPQGDIIKAEDDNSN